MKILPVLLLASAAVVSMNAQTPPLAFEVASIKPNVSRPATPAELTLGCHGTDSHSPGIIIPLSRCVVRYEPLRLVVALAYDIPPSLLYPYDGKVLSGPDWINSTIYSIDAKADAPATEAELKLSIWAGRIVVDKNGVSGLFDIKMPPMTSANPAPSPERERKAGDGGTPGLPSGALGAPNPIPTVFTAVEQIGLKLESTKGPVDVLVIDHIEKPTEN